MNYRFNTHHSLVLNFSRQSVFPSVVQLNPYNSSSDTLTVSTGNPYLKPYHVSKLRLAYTLTGGGFFVEPFVSSPMILITSSRIGEIS
ncbi:outer membrane beta-barrel protein [uncultured Bacteroides sp.]|uniref:outer membrane beta-barrel protein n=1 Tax=uncultured Bacteroides sp. TaxID=162156 RepID=UPI0035A6CC83